MADFHFSFEATGTTWVIDLKSQEPNTGNEELINLVKNRIELFEQTYSRFRNDSWISKISKQPGIYELPFDAKEMFDLYFYLYNVTGGLFTPLMGQILEDAGYDSHYSFTIKEVINAAPSLQDCLSYSYPSLEIKKLVHMDFGACGKGRIIDLVGNLLSEINLDSFCVDAGGDILYKNKTKKKLRIGLEDPRDPTQVIGICDLEGGSICGSSGNRRKWGRFHHIINPQTLESPKDVLSAWVVADSAMIADALATCLFFVEPKTLTDKFHFEYVRLFADFSVEKSANFPGTVFNV